jgi:hypothetical protein
LRFAGEMRKRILLWAGATRELCGMMWFAPYQTRVLPCAAAWRGRSLRPTAAELIGMQ